MRRLLGVHLGEKIGKDFERNGERRIRYCERLHIVLLVRELDSDLCGPRLILLLGIQKHLFYVLSKNACDLESQRQTLFRRFFAAERADKLIHLILGFLLHDSVAFLNLTDPLIATAVNDCQVVVGELSPLFFYVARILLPFSFQLIPVHRILLIFKFYETSAGSALRRWKARRALQDKRSTQARARTYRETLTADWRGEKSSESAGGYRIPRRPIGVPPYGDGVAQGLQQKSIAAD